MPQVHEPVRLAYRPGPARVVFGDGALDLVGEELERAGFSRAFLIGGSGRRGVVDRLKEQLAARLAGSFAVAVQHVPEALVALAGACVAERDPDCLVAVGGGSTIGLAKAVAVASGLPVVAVPTTYSGSEMTPIWGSTGAEGKRTGRDARAAPVLVVYDPLLTLDLPPGASGCSGMNAMAHAVEALYAPDAGPVSDRLAEAAAALVRQALPVVTRHGMDRAARRSVLLGAHYAGRALGMTSMGLHHKLCHVLGGSFGLPHAETHAVLLPHVAAFNAPAAPRAMRRLAVAMGVRDAPAGLLALQREVGAPRSLSQLGFPADGVQRAADLVLLERYPSPGKVARSDVLGILRAAAAQPGPARDEGHLLGAGFDDPRSCE